MDRKTSEIVGRLTDILQTEGRIEKVGPKGYVHGWIHVGSPNVGDRIYDPVHGPGTVTGTKDKTSVRFDRSGDTHHFEKRPEGEKRSLSGVKFTDEEEKILDRTAPNTAKLNLGQLQAYRDAYKPTSLGGRTRQDDLSYEAIIRELDRRGEKWTPNNR